MSLSGEQDLRHRALSDPVVSRRPQLRVPRQADGRDRGTPRPALAPPARAESRGPLTTGVPAAYSRARGPMQVRLSRSALVHAPAVLAGGVAAALYVGAGVLVTAVALLGVIAVRCRPGRAATSGLRVPSRFAVDLAGPVGLVAATVAVVPHLAGADPVIALRQGLAVVLVGNLAHVASAAIGRRLARPPQIVVVSDRSVAAVAAERWSGRRGAHVVGSVVLDHAAADAEAAPFDPENAAPVAVASSVESVVARVEEWQADLVVVVPGSDLSAREVRQLSWRLEHTGVGVALAGVLDAVAPHRLGFGSLAGATVVLSGSSRPSAGVRAAKWVLDRLGAALLLLPALPVLALAAIAIRLDSPGPALFRQERAGIGGRPFTMLKLRTMYLDADARVQALADADQGHGPLFKIHRDPRVTRVGSLLRRSSLDELPQLVNVLRGEMSLVGPRPALPREVATYDEHVARRLVVRPGMTGLWQISGRSDLDWAESVELDLHYADNYRLTDDLLIGLRTVEAVARARGAY